MANGLFIDAASSVSRPGVYAIEVAPPRQIRGVSNGYVGVVGFFAWGPVGTAYLPTSGDDLLQTFEPKGSPRTSTGYQSLMGRLAAPWYIVGIKGSGNAVATLSESGTGGNLVFTAKYAGAFGNSIQVTQQAASNGDATARDLIATVTNPTTKTTTEYFRNVALNENLAVRPEMVGSRLLASITWSATLSAWPVNYAAVNLASGSDGSALVSGDYDNGFAQLDVVANVRIYCSDDCGDSIRAAVESAKVTRVINLSNRVAYVHGNAGNTWAQVKTDKLNYTSDRVCYFGAWVQTYDDSGTLRRTPLSTFAATARVMGDVSWPIAWRDLRVQKYYTGVKAIDPTCPFATASPTIQDEATKLGIILPVALANGGFGLHLARTANLTSGLQYEVSRWYKDYLALSIVPALDAYVNGPNSPDDNIDIKGQVDKFMYEEERLRHVVKKKQPDGSIAPAFSTDIDSVNSTSTLANGDFYIQLDAGTPGVRERIFLLVNAGETVTVR